MGSCSERAEAADLHLHAPLNAVIRFGKAGERLVPVKLRAHLTEVGTLEVWADSKISEHHWRLQFELRKTAGARTGGKPAAVVSDEAVAQAEALLDAAFRSGTVTPEELPGKLEQTLALGRNSWPLSAIRRLSDRLLELAECRRKSPALEMRWLNLCGFCCVPASDFPATIFASSKPGAFTPEAAIPQSSAERDRLVDLLGPRRGRAEQEPAGGYFPAAFAGAVAARVETPAAHQQQSAARNVAHGASLELLPLQTKTQLGDALLAQVKKGEMVETGLWCLSRLGARKLFYGPINQVLPAQAATRWVEALLKVPKAEDAVVAIARRTGDSTRDLSPATIDDDPQANSEKLSSRARRRSGRRSRQSVRRRAAVGPVVAAVIMLVTEDSIIRKASAVAAPLIGDDCAVIPSPIGQDLLVHDRS